MSSGDSRGRAALTLVLPHGVQPGPALRFFPLFAPTHASRLERRFECPVGFRPCARASGCAPEFQAWPNTADRLITMGKLGQQNRSVKHEVQKMQLSPEITAL